MKCNNCKLNPSCTMVWRTSKKECPHFIQPTNADRIRAMSDEEMVKSLIPMLYDLCEDGVPCDEYIRDWLKQPCKEG